MMSENVEITLNGVDVSRCKYLYNSKEGLLCTLYDYDVFYDTRCADNPECYYKQWQREKQQNEKLKKTLKEIAEIAKTKIYTPICFEDPDCPKNGGVGFDNNCDEYCPLITIERISEKIKEVENDK